MPTSKKVTKPQKLSSSLLKDLNKEQQEAVTSTEGPLLIIAGAGSGKTKTLTHRVAYLITEKRVSPQHIAALTFTNKAAREMSERVVKLTGAKKNSPTMGTFHSFCARILRKYGGPAGIPPSFTIYDADESRSLMKSVIVDSHLSLKDVAPPAVLNKISAWKDNLYDIKEVKELASDLWEQQVAKLWEIYQERLKKADALDFDDLLYRTVKILQKDKELLFNLQGQYRYISVDEYQDTNHAQFSLIKMLAGNNNNVCAVGDDAQSIYGWRGARVENIRNFPQHFPNCKTVTLSQNYRSTQAILHSANQLIAKGDSFPKELWTRKREGSPPHLIRAGDEKDEGLRILKEFSDLFSVKEFTPAAAAILYRTNAQSRALEEACLQLAIPYEIIGGLTFYERKEVKDIVAYLRFVNNPQDEMAFRRMANVPTRGVGDKTIEDCLKEARFISKDPLDEKVRQKIPASRRQKLDSLADTITELRQQKEKILPGTILKEILKKTDFRNWLRQEALRTQGTPDPGEARYENVLELATVAKRHQTLTSLLEEIALISDAEKSSSKSKEKEKVKLMTIHAAKGLEFPLVAVAGLEEGLLPHQNSMDSAAETEEERRLCYVAITRAKEKLYLSYARSRTIYGKMAETTPSRFIDDIPDHTGSAKDTLAGEGKTGTTFFEEEPVVYVEEDELPYKAGEKVLHETFGEGIVEAVNGTILSVSFAEGRKELDGTIAPLKKVSYAET